MKWIFLLCLWSSSPSRAEDQKARPQYCEPKPFDYSGSPENHTEINLEEVLNPEELSKPGMAQLLAATPGPYGHSKLGFRYLARLFGYAGRFGSDKEVENTVLLEEQKDGEVKNGLSKQWDHWVVHAPKRLAVPAGALSKLPENGDPGMFFLDARDRFEHARCLKLDIGTQFCQNYLGWKQDFEEGMKIRFPASARGATFYQYCKMHVYPWKWKLLQRREKEFLTGNPDGGGDVKNIAK